MIICRPADDLFRMAVDDRRQVKPALPRRNIRNVADHFLAGRGSGEITVHQVGDAVLLAVALGEAEPPRPRLAGLQAQLAHDGADQPRPGRHAPGRQVRVDPPVPVRPSESSNDFRTNKASIPRLFAVADSGALRHS